MKRKPSPLAIASWRKNSHKSCYRGIGGQRDIGQRYIVSYVDGTGQRRDFGFTDDLEEARKWALKVKANPMWNAVKIRERKVQPVSGEGA